MKTSEVLRKAKAVIERRGWTKGTYGSIGGGPMCAMGAVYHVEESGPFGPHLGLTEGFLVEFLSEGVESWNDRPDRTKEEVLDAFERAAALAESRGD